MKEIKRTIEEVTGYEANDGTWFRHKEECERYEQGAFMAAKIAAKALAVNEKGVDDVAPFTGCCEERIVTYDIKTAADLQVLNTWLELEYRRGDKVDPKYIGKRVAIQYWIDNGHFVLGTREDIEENFKCKMDKLFVTPEGVA